MMEKSRSNVDLATMYNTLGPGNNGQQHNFGNKFGQRRRSNFVKAGEKENSHIPKTMVIIPSSSTTFESKGKANDLDKTTSQHAWAKCKKLAIGVTRNGSQGAV